MKARLITLLFMGFIAVNAASAAQELNHADGKKKNRCGLSQQCPYA